MSRVHCEAVNSCQCHETWNLHWQWYQDAWSSTRCSLTVQGSPSPHSQPCPPDSRRRFDSCGMFITTYLVYYPALAMMINHRVAPQVSPDNPAHTLCTLLLFFMILAPPCCHPSNTLFSSQCPPCPNKQPALITFCPFSPSFAKSILKSTISTLLR